MILTCGASSSKLNNLSQVGKVGIMAEKIAEASDNATMYDLDLNGVPIGIGGSSGLHVTR